MNDTEALNAIQAVMSGAEWSPNTLNDIADIVRNTGREVRNSDTDVVLAADLRVGDVFRGGIITAVETDCGTHVEVDLDREVVVDGDDIAVAGFVLDADELVEVGGVLDADAPAIVVSTEHDTYGIWSDGSIGPTAPVPDV